MRAALDPKRIATRKANIPAVTVNMNIESAIELPSCLSKIKLLVTGRWFRIVGSFSHIHEDTNCIIIVHSAQYIP